MLTVTIEKLVYGGYGLARTDQGVIFISDVAPGETAAIEMTGKKGGCATGRPVEIVKPSPSRRLPPCPYAGTCGGCDWLHLTYETQLAAKLDIVRDCMRRLGGIDKLPEIEAIASPEFSYRQRAQFKLNGNGGIGFFARETYDVVVLRSCPLLVRGLNDLLADINEKKVPLAPGMKNLMAVAGDADAIASSPALRDRTLESVTLSAGNRKFNVAGSHFFQGNRPLLERLGTWPQRELGGGLCIDLYGGSGFFSIMLADGFKQGLLVESIAGQAEAANKNFSLNAISHFKAVHGQAEDVRSLIKSEKVECLIVDPPRPGLTRTVREAIGEIKPAALLYVSCNPSTQARDTGFFVNHGGYAIDKAAVFDLYPNTHHIESVLLLRRK